ncbi:MAG: hypothetical protein Ct9H300mP2_3240 [Candidatus Neomarinimicrobiota bacterium]|nr:MAG: hypothetical protein Ct9H300mP2_3240 [Candidatus Neomarinimicrobiota bacterium]
MSCDVFLYLSITGVNVTIFDPGAFIALLLRMKPGNNKSLLELNQNFNELFIVESIINNESRARPVNIIFHNIIISKFNKVNVIISCEVSSHRYGLSAVPFQLNLNALYVQKPILVPLKSVNSGNDNSKDFVQSGRTSNNVEQKSHQPNQSFYYRSANFVHYRKTHYKYPGSRYSEIRVAVILSSSNRYSAALE